MRRALIAIAALALAGCASVRHCDVGGRHMVVIDNTGWYFLNVVPLASGNPERPNSCSCRLFRQTTTLENNMKMLDREAKEMLVETVESEDLFTNPALFIASYRQYRDRLKVNSSGPDSLDITLILDEGVKARFLLKNVVFSDLTGEKKDFSVDEKSLDSAYVVTDLR